MKYFPYLFLLLVVACSSTEEKTEPKTYSDETNRAFLQIERGDSYYMKRPAKNTPPPQVKSPHQTRPATRPVYREDVRPAEIVVKPARREEKPSREEIVIDEKINYQEPQKEKSITTIIPKSQPKTKKSAPMDERLIEINQNLAFYCMKHRKDARFGDSEEKCMAFVNQSLEDCQRVHKTPDKKLLSCIQTKLKRR
nr:DUF3139 domain-containing protein [Bacteriovorax sp. HI3]